MKSFSQLSIIAGIHIAYLIFVYGTGFFGLDLPYYFFIMLWLVASSLMAFAAYFWIISKSHWPFLESSSSLKNGALAATATSISLYLGVFVAINTYGT